MPKLKTEQTLTRPTLILVKEAITVEELNAVRGLMRAMVGWLFDRHHEYRELVNRYFDPVSFEGELEGLPGQFEQPEGLLLLARVGDEYAGCVGLRKLEDGICEMKRLYVDPSFQSSGVGSKLATRLISEARSQGYRKMRLDTGPKQFEAVGLYEKLGFKHIEPYYELSIEMKNWLTFMEFDLTGTA